jgi:RNA polymerase sigma factor for flagellar operon FliA
VHKDLPVRVELDDLLHGVLGLFEAVKNYDPDKQVLFASYAKHRIKGAILDSLRELDGASRSTREKPAMGATRQRNHTPGVLKERPAHSAR